MQGASAAFGSFGKGGGTPTVPSLAAVYAFGLTDEPPNGLPSDNIFGMLSGQWQFPGFTDYGSAGRTAATSSLIQNKAAVALSSPPSALLLSNAWQNNGVGGLGCGNFIQYELYDPSWNGFFGSITGGVQWPIEVILGSNDITHPPGDPAQSATLFASRSYNANALSAVTVPNAGVGPSQPGTGGAFQQAQAIWNNSFGNLLSYQNSTGYGWDEKVVYRLQPGASSQWVTHWNQLLSSSVANDGPAWLIDVDGRFGRFAIACGLQFYQRTGDVFGPWGAKVIIYDGTPASVLTIGADFKTDSQGGPELNGRPVTTVFRTSAVDLTATDPAVTIVPAVPGKRFVPLPTLGNGFLFTTTTESIGGSLGTPAVIVFKAGATTIYTGSPLDATIFAEGLYGLGGDTIVETAGIPPNTPITVEVDTAATGAPTVAWSVAFHLQGYYL